MGLDLEPWEPEETVGKLWHSWASGFDAPQDFADQAVTLAEVSPRLAVLFRGLGGAPSVEIGLPPCRPRATASAGAASWAPPPKPRR